MHELSLAENMLRIIEDAAHEQDFRRVRAVVLEIGRLAAVEPDAMRFCFEAVTSGSIAEGARLEIIESAGQGRCATCHGMAKISDLEKQGFVKVCEHWEYKGSWLLRKA